MYITVQGCRIRNDLYCVEWDVKLYYTIPFARMSTDLDEIWQGFVVAWITIVGSVSPR